MKKSQIITKILNLAKQKGTVRTAARAKLGNLTVAQLRTVHAQAKAKVAAGQGQAAKQQTKAQKKATKKKTTRRSQKLSKSVKARVGKITRGIASGKIAVKQGKAKPSDYASGTSKQKYAKFIALYKGVRVPKKGAKQKAPSISAVYAQMAGAEGRSKYPYYLSKGYHVHAFNVGGGKSGPGIVRKIPGSSAPAFSTLSASKQSAVVKFLNSAKGQVLRSKGAPKKASLQAMKQAKKAAAQKKKSRGKAQKKGAANWW